jgi:carboxymethylenebutenolidase
MIEHYLAEPSSPTKHGVVVIHEWHGLVPSVKAIADRFAAEGFLAIAPDHYHGQVATDDARAGQLMQAMVTRDAVAEIAQAVTFLRDRGCTSVGVIGFCMGGALAFAAAAAVEGLTCAVPFYGIPIAEYWDAAKMRVPIQAHFVRVDNWAKAERAEEMQKQIRARGGHMDLFVYDAPHAFMRADDPKVHNAEAAAAAWPRALDFLRSH